MIVHFLQASVPLTKTYAAVNGEIVKTPYPMTWEFTSHKETVKDLRGFESLIKKHASLGNCLLKGSIAKPLVKESRAGSTQTNDTTEWLVLDLDGLPERIDITAPGGQPVSTPMTIDLFLSEMGLQDISYIVQWSASYGIENKKIRAHVFMLLDKPYMAPLLKQYLIQKNHEVSFLREAMTLTKTGNSISWPLDVSACQNDKLIYIAPPVLKGIKDPMGKTPRISLVKRKYDTLGLASTINTTDMNSRLTHARINELRDASGLMKRKFTYKMVGQAHVLLNSAESTITEMKTERGFVYFNLNGGDSWAYYHPEDKPDYIHNFKGEPSYLTKELLPDYWLQITSSGNLRTSSSGITYLAFCDRKSGAYWRGTYDNVTDVLDINVAKNETQLRHFALANGVPLSDYVPEWDLVFDPQNSVRVDTVNKVINKFLPSPYMKAQARKVTKCPPTIFKVLHHALGCDVDITEHFINWISYVLQKRDRTKTAWVLHGTQGCLAAETQVEFNRGARNGGRPLSIKDAYLKWTGQFKQGTGLGKSWDMSIPTRAKAVRDEMTIGYHEVFNIVESGVKQLYKLTASNGKVIRATELHPFMRPDGSFTPLNELKPGDEIVVEGLPVNDKYTGGRKTRHTTYSIPYHPYAWQHMINGKNYKRIHTARLVVEADMNGFSLDDFVSILRTSPERAEGLAYLSPSDLVHHVDEDPSNDVLSNLVIIDKVNHDSHHAKETGRGYISTKIVKVKSIKKDKEEMTYDMVMKAPYHNYVANGFVVHNTGKGILTNNILRPIFGAAHTASRRMEELGEKYNQFMAESLLVFVDEVQIKSMQNEKGVMAKLKNFITEEFVPMRQMYSNGTEGRNYTNWIFMSNMSDPVMIDKNDRRFNVGAYQPTKLAISNTELAQIEKELQGFHDFLLSYPLDEHKAGEVIHSVDRETMISISESSIDTVASAILDGKFGFFIDALPTDESYKRSALMSNKVEDYRSVLTDLMARTAPDGKCNIARDELRVLFDYVVGNIPTSPNKFTSLLKHHRVHTQAVWVQSKTVNGISVKWTDVGGFSQYVKEHFTPKGQKPKSKATK